MTAFLGMPDLEAVCSIALREAGYRSYSSIPRDPAWPLIVVKRTGGSPAVRQKLDAASIQLDVWGGAKGDAGQVTKSELRAIVDGARLTILELEGTTFHVSTVDAYITGVNDQLGPQWLPDPQTGRDRYVFSMVVFGELLPPLDGS